jgi:prepilin-type N-terminal cleavage/methylation domain-containing protein
MQTLATDLVKARRGARAFTLVELMAVVAIVGILALLGTVGVRKYIRSSKTSEALVMVGSIKMAQEEYLRDTFTYKDISGVNKLDGSGTSFPTFYPTTTPLKRGTKMAWGGGTDAVANGWRELGVKASAPVMYIYGCAAGPGSMAPAPPGMSIGNYPPSATGQPWYLIKAVADLDGDGTVGTYVGTSLTAEIFHDKEEE